VSYVDAGYSICLTVLFLYGGSLLLRRRRLLRAATVAERGSTVSSTGNAPDGVAAVDDGDER
jgi:hypothetical protein